MNRPLTGGLLCDFNRGYAPIAVLVVLVFATASWFIGGRQHFMKDVPAGHDTKLVEEIFNL